MPLWYIDDLVSDVLRKIMTRAKEFPIIYQDDFLEKLCRKACPVAVYLLNGIKLQGHILTFDTHVVILRAAAISQMIYKHAILTIVPI